MTKVAHGNGEAVNALLLNRDGFQMPADGWYQLAPLGEFSHAAAGVVQVVDAEACAAMAARFKADAGVEPFDKLRAERFAGLLVDFDHFSLDGEKRSEAAGWIVDLEARDGRPPSPGGSGATGPAAPEAAANAGAGLWAKIRWSDVGEEAVKGGRYRFLSPVWARSDCVDLGTDPGSGRQRVRPVRLLNAAVTNDPNLKGLAPLSNASTALSAGSGGRAMPIADCRVPNGEGGEGSHAESVDSRALGRDGQSGGAAGKGERSMKAVIERLVNHLGLPADATEAAILEKMQGLPALTAVADLQNSLKQAQTERDELQEELKTAEAELVNRHLAEFEGVISNESREFWAEQLLENREAAVGALKDLKKSVECRVSSEDGAAGAGEAGRRRPLHNRATARPVIPGQGVGATGTDARAVKIRNRAQEIAKAEGVAFSAAFRRAEKEVMEG